MRLFMLSALDPRSKMVMMLSFSTLAMTSDDLFFLFMLVLLICLILIGGGCRVFSIFRQARSIIGIVLFLFIVQCLFVRTGVPLIITGGYILVTKDGFFLASMLSLRLLVIVFSALIMLTGEPRDYLLALVEWKIPYEIAFMVMAAIRFLPLLREEALNVFYSVQLRGTELKKTTLKRKLEIYLRICLPILVCALNRVRSMSMAMEGKAFRAYPRRTYMRRLALKVRDKLIILSFPLLTVILIAMRFNK